jgi:hypothetical protein
MKLGHGACVETGHAGVQPNDCTAPLLDSTTKRTKAKPLKTHRLEYGACGITAQKRCSRKRDLEGGDNAASPGRYRGWNLCFGYPKVELFINVIWRELDMAIRLVRGETKAKEPVRVNTTYSLFPEEPDEAAEAERLAREERFRVAQEATKATLEATLNSVFAGDGWRKINAEDSDGRADQCAALFREITGARWGTHFRMMDNGRVRYFLLHLTNHPDGRDLMKECMWKACPHGGFYASKSDHPDQVVIMEPEPDLKPLREWVTQRLASGPRRWNALTNDLREELWMGKHLNTVLKAMHKGNAIAGTEFVGQFAMSNNPLLSLTKHPQPAGAGGHDDL